VRKRAGKVITDSTYLGCFRACALGHGFNTSVFNLKQQISFCSHNNP